ncbi:ATP-binding protein [Brevibacillus sp. TJ4]|uniref:ATP-binding protein n=1 Tax=Brevibacillus sp. TJ4 TaxID=3234853 RepID=UPI0037D84E58
MVNKQEILEKLTGIKSSRKSYYTELTYLVEEMKKKNSQLAVLNRLTQIQINASWHQTSVYIAAQLKQILPFEHFALTLWRGGTLSTYLSRGTGGDWECQTLNQTAPADMSSVDKQIDAAFAQILPDYFATSVPLRNLSHQTFGCLTLFNRETVRLANEELDLFHLVAGHVAVSVENILLFQDLSEKVKIEAQLVQSAKMAAIGEIAAGIAHELNNPLTAILGNAQLLLREQEANPTDMTPLLRDMYQCGVRCKKIIQNLLTFSRQEEYQFEKVELTEALDDALGLIGYQLAVSGLSVECEKAPYPLPFYGSRHQIEQIILNLLLNARDALAGRENPRIAIRLFRQEEEGKSYAALTVRDNGVGIAPEHLPHLFQPFFTTKERSKGTGLGLSVSLGIALAHGGKLLVSSEPGQYSEFTLLLPLLADEEACDGEETHSDRR